MHAKFILSLIASVFALAQTDGVAKNALDPAEVARAVPGWLLLRVQNDFATKNEIALYQKLLRQSNSAQLGKRVSGGEVCPGCQSTSICPDNCVGGCQSSDTGGCKTSCLLPGLMSGG
ncbi:MAG: hypothetical protein ACLQME_07110 [Alphaproteobacteria bacterium]